MARVPQCEFVDVVGFDTRNFNPGERVCVRRGGETVLGTFRGMAPQHIYGDQDAMDPFMDDVVNGYLITGIDPEPAREHSVQYSDVGKLKNKISISPSMVTQLSRQKNLPEDVERELKKYGGKKKTRRSRKPRRKNKKATRKG